VKEITFLKERAVKWEEFEKMLKEKHTNPRELAGLFIEVTDDLSYSRTHYPKSKTTQKDWGDTIFRKVRYFNKSMELWTITVIIVESAAQIFYAALRDATDCKLLKSICQDILIDEAHHIKFQNERMYQIFQRKSFYNKAISVGLYSVLFFGTMHAIWLGHRKAFVAGGISKKEFYRLMYYKFFKSITFLHSEPEKESKMVLAYSAGK
jgi:hypothetical protein